MTTKIFSFLPIVFSAVCLLSCTNSTETLESELVSTKNDKLFKVREGVEADNIPLGIQGKIPLWLEGTYVRNGPGKFTIGDQTISHWFDGFAMLASFSFKNSQVLYSAKFLQSDQLIASQKNNKIYLTGFAENFAKLSQAHKSKDNQKVVTANANINIEHIGRSYVALGETPLPIEFELKTLNTVGIFDYNDKLKKSRIWESAHIKRSPEDSILWNYYTDYGLRSNYVIYNILPGSTERKIVSKVATDVPSYMHDFSITKNYIVFTAYPLILDPRGLMTGKKSFMGAHKWEPKRKTKIYVINKKNGKVVSQLLTDPMFAFHHINAFEDNNEIKLYLSDSPTYGSVINLSSYPVAKKANLHLSELTINLANGLASKKILSEEEFELPTINPNYQGKKNQFFYAVRYSLPKSENGYGLVKYDLSSNKFVSWHLKDHYATEPVFVPKPGSNKEDEGVVLSLVYNKAKNQTFLIILDAMNFTELGRAFLPNVLPFGFHGKFFNN